MSDNYIMLNRSEETNWLLENHPNAFLLLTAIALRARRLPNLPDGLQIGDALIGDHKSYGLSRQQYRTALEKLIEFKIVKIIYNGKKFIEREKSTIKITIKGMLVNLIDSKICNINPKTDNQHVNQRATNEQPTGNHEQERTRKKKNEKEQHPYPSSKNGNVVLFDFLKNIGLDETSIFSLSRDFHDKAEILERAVKYTLQPHVFCTITKSLGGFIRTIANTNPYAMTLEEKDNLAKQNHQIATKIYKRCKENMKNIMTCKSDQIGIHIEVIETNKTITINYEQNSHVFKQQLEGELRKHGVFIAEDSTLYAN